MSALIVIEIKHRRTGAVLYTHETTAERQASGLAMRDALEAAAAARANLADAYLARAYLARANLAGANLAGAYLAGAYLARADLAGANLAGADGAKLTLVGDRPALSIGPIGSRADYLTAFITDAGVMVRAGCFFEARDEFAEAVEREHGNSIHGDEYRAALVLIDAHARLWTPAQEPAIQDAAA